MHIALSKVQTCFIVGGEKNKTSFVLCTDFPLDNDEITLPFFLAAHLHPFLKNLVIMGSF